MGTTRRSKLEFESDILWNAFHWVNKMQGRINKYVYADLRDHSGRITALEAEVPSIEDVAKQVAKIMARDAKAAKRGKVDG